MRIFIEQFTLYSLWLETYHCIALVLVCAESPTLEKSPSSVGFAESTGGGQASKWKLVRSENGIPCFIQFSPCLTFTRVQVWH